MENTRKPMPMMEDGKVLRLGDLDFSGDWVGIDVDHATILHDSRKDGGDVSPLLSLAPVSFMILVSKDIYYIGLITDDLDLKEE